MWQDEALGTSEDAGLGQSATTGLDMGVLYRVGETRQVFLSFSLSSSLRTTVLISWSVSIFIFCEGIISGVSMGKSYPIAVLRLFLVETLTLVCMLYWQGAATYTPRMLAFDLRGKFAAVLAFSKLTKMHFNTVDLDFIT